MIRLISQRLLISLNKYKKILFLNSNKHNNKINKWLNLKTPNVLVKQNFYYIILLTHDILYIYPISICIFSFILLKFSLRNLFF